MVSYKDNSSIAVDVNMEQPIIAGAGGHQIVATAQEKEDASILMLYDDIVYNICTYLDVNSVVAFAQSCKMIRFRLQGYVKQHYKHVNFTMWRNASDEINLLKLAGKYVEHYEGEISAKDLSSLCPNLEVLAATQTYDVKDLVNLGKLKKLKRLDITLRQNEESAIMFSEVLNCLRCLQKLKVSFVYYKKGRGFDVYSPYNASFLFKIMHAKIHNLRHLNMLGNWTGQKHFEKIIEKCPQLERLEYWGGVYKCILELSKLQHLHIDSYRYKCNNVCCTDFIELLLKKFKCQLQSLILPREYPSDKMWQLIARLSSLRELKVAEIKKSSLKYLLQLTKLESLHFAKHDFEEEQWSQIFYVCLKLHTLFFDKIDKNLLESLRVATKYRKKFCVVTYTKDGEYNEYDEYLFYDKNDYDYIEKLSIIHDLSSSGMQLMDIDPL